MVGCSVVVVPHRRLLLDAGAEPLDVLLIFGQRFPGVGWRVLGVRV